MVTILVYTNIPFSINCGGIVVQYELCRMLDNLGISVRIQSPTKIHNQIFNKYYNNDFDLNQTVVIYGETIEGNPLNAPYVMRWILAPVGVICAPIHHTWGKNDIIYYFNSDETFNNNEDKIGKIYKTLTTIYMNPLINNFNYKDRKGYCHTFRKSGYHKTIKYAHPPGKSIEIKREHSFVECIKILNKSQFFISYDPLSFLSIIASMCGCISVVIKVDGINELEWLKTTAAYPYLKEKNINKLFGIAYGVSEIDWAKKTLHLAKAQWNEIIKHAKNTTVFPFLRDIQNIENISYLENTVKNIFG